MTREKNPDLPFSCSQCGRRFRLSSASPLRPRTGVFDGLHETRRDFEIEEELKPTVLITLEEYEELKSRPKPKKKVKKEVERWVWIDRTGNFSTHFGSEREAREATVNLKSNSSAAVFFQCSTIVKLTGTYEVEVKNED